MVSRNHIIPAFLASEKNTNRFWRILSAVAITAGGIWFTLGSPNPTKPHSSPSPNHKSEENKPPSLEEEKKQKAHKKFMDSMAADAPKPEHGGSSVDNHGKAAENNMHKVRTGKFSGKEFDNHISKHSANPGKDFECIEEEKKEEDGKSKWLRLFIVSLIEWRCV